MSVAIFVVFRLARAATTDRTVPVIEMGSDSITVSVEGGDEAILEGVTATDGKDGDITQNLFIESRTTFLEKGRFNVIIAVADRDNHISKATREVIYSDYRSPQFSLSNPLKFSVAKESQDDLNIASGLGAKDVIDGNINNKVKIASEYSINSNVPGNYHMEFMVTNSMGDTSKLTVTVTIYSNTQESGLPQIILSQYLINTPVGAEDHPGRMEPRRGPRAYHVPRTAKERAQQVHQCLQERQQPSSHLSGKCARQPESLESEEEAADKDV